MIKLYCKKTSLFSRNTENQEICNSRPRSAAKTPMTDDYEENKSIRVHGVRNPMKDTEFSMCVNSCLQSQHAQE